MPVQKIVDRAVAGRMPDRLFIGRLEIVDVQHLARTSSLGKARQQSLFPGQRHVLALTAADRFRLSIDSHHPDSGLAQPRIAVDRALRCTLMRQQGG